MGANDMQVGGNHYKSELQHWDMIEENGIGYLEAAATKYVTRHRKKGGLGDLGKAYHYVEKLIELHKSINRLPRGIVPIAVLERFSMANHLTRLEGEVVFHLCRWDSEEYLLLASMKIEDLIEIANQAEHDANGPGPGEPF